MVLTSFCLILLFYSSSNCVVSFLFSVLDIIYAVLRFIFAHKWYHCFLCLPSLGLADQVFSSTDCSNEICLLSPQVSQAVTSQFGDIWESLTFVYSWTSCTVTLCKLHNYSLLSEAAVWMVNAMSRTNRQVERCLWEYQRDDERHLPLQVFLLSFYESPTWAPSQRPHFCFSCADLFFYCSNFVSVKILFLYGRIYAI